MSVSRQYVTSKAINRSKDQCKEVISVLQNLRFEGEFIAMLANNEKCNKTKTVQEGYSKLKQFSACRGNVCLMDL